MADWGTRAAERAVERLLDSVPTSRRNAADARIVIDMAQRIRRLLVANDQLEIELEQVKSHAHWLEDMIDELKELHPPSE